MPLQRDRVGPRFKYVNWAKLEHVSGYFFLWEFLLAITLDWSDIVELEIADA